MTKDLRVNSERMLSSFNQLAAIGATEQDGVHRPALSEAHLAARKWFREEVERAGLEFHVDGAGNHSAVFVSDGRVAPPKSGGVYRDQTLLIGSHLDSVPNGGRFDGALGVVAALEVLKTIKENGIKPKVQLEAIDFTDEEGTLVGLLGSAALTGHLHPELLQNPRGGRENLVEGMKRAGLSDESMLSAVRPKESIVGYLELHIEQGKRLERADINIGVVSAIVGISSYRLSFIGRADHAGSTTMRDRLDASLGSSAFTLAAHELVMKEFPNCVVNIGDMKFTPGAFNIVPAQVDVSLEFRSADESEFDRLDASLLALAREQAARFGLELKADFRGRHDPTPMSNSVQQAFVDSCDALELTHQSLVSGAGHDGQSFAGVCPMGMIFVPSVNGTSHSPHEFTMWSDCVNGANVLLQAALRLGQAE
jgi:beta-ureidopropionase / N-carbamoyl-L-amino-acid hydrolase